MHFEAWCSKLHKIIPHIQYSHLPKIDPLPGIKNKEDIKATIVIYVSTFCNTCCFSFENLLIDSIIDMINNSKTHHHNVI